MHGGNFDQEAAHYDRVRPRYPEALFDRLVVHCGLSKGMKAFEIGPGTGQATEALARRGLCIRAVELGPKLAEVARTKLAAFPDVEILTGDFESMDLPAGKYDLVYAATAIHWIGPDHRFAKPHRLLKAGGHLAIIHAEHVSDRSGDAFTAATQPVYHEFSGNPDAVDFCPPTTADLAPMAIDTDLFRPVCYEIFPMALRYSAAGYVDLLRTFSPTIAMAPESREAFLGAIGGMIERDFGGTVSKHMAMTLLVARKV